MSNELISKFPAHIGSRPILAAESVFAGYVSGAPVLHDISIGLERGEILAVIGPNGAGKTTLFKALSGELALLSGKVRLYVDGKGSAQGQDLHRLPARQRALHIARVLQMSVPPGRSPSWTTSKRGSLPEKAGSAASLVGPRV